MGRLEEAIMSRLRFIGGKCCFGHTLSKENSYISPKGWVMCRTCSNRRRKEYWNTHLEFCRKLNRDSMNKKARARKLVVLDHYGKVNANVAVNLTFYF